MFWRALLAFLICPGTVAYAVPLLLAPSRTPTRSLQWLGAPILLIGTALLLWCVRDFHVAGRGTLAPWAPPKKLVTVGLYRWSRNPMYVAVAVILAGWATWFASSALALYAVTFCIAFHLRVVRYEEPRLDASFGPQWRQYRSAVRRWL